MNASLALTAHIVLAAVTLGTGAHAFAGQELMGVDTRFRAKIAKEKIRIGAQERKADEQGKSQGNRQDSGGCGSQNIGNIDTGGRIGAAPREVFVFAPNAINIIGRGGCR